MSATAKHPSYSSLRYPHCPSPFPRGPRRKFTSRAARTDAAAARNSSDGIYKLKEKKKIEAFATDLIGPAVRLERWRKAINAKLTSPVVSRSRLDGSGVTTHCPGFVVEKLKHWLLNGEHDPRKKELPSVVVKIVISGTPTTLPNPMFQPIMSPELFVEKLKLEPQPAIQLLVSVKPVLVNAGKASE